MRSILRWAGSKRAQIPTLRSAMPTSYNKYLEPFAGSCCLYFSALPADAILSDNNKNLIDTWKTIADQPELVYARAVAIPRTREAYFETRNAYNEEQDPLKRASYFFYLNRFCYNGVYRTNRQGRFNVPPGITTGSMPALDEFVMCSKRLRCADIRCCDFQEACGLASDSDFVYLDPPYSRSSHFSGEYGYTSFRSSDEDRLLTCLHDLSSKGAMVLLSYSGEESFRNCLPRDWSVDQVSVRRSVAANSEDRKQEVEIIARNYP
jgi:DNA adenine methylase